ncbi:MAG: YraN family protein [Candidatus Omnitrophica bacterium]|nr:YraN family protein [Candidatus Omnitrophota bacterium]
MNKTGSLGERIAVKHLKKCGYKIIETNFKLKCGEIDIIGKDNNYICFIEVKTQTSNEFKQPFEEVDYFKQEKLRLTAEIWLTMRNLCDSACRFDIVSVILSDNPHSHNIKVIKDAFWV